MTCRELAEFLMDYVERALTADELAEFESHMDECPPCKVYLDQYRDAVRMGKAAFDDPDANVPDDVPPKLIAAILAARPKASHS